MKNRLITMLLAASLASATSVPKAIAAIELVRDGRAHACLVFDSRWHPLKKDVANQWCILERTSPNIAAVVVDYVRKSAGAALRVVDLARERPPSGQTLIYIGRCAFVNGRLGRELDALDSSGYLIRALDDRRLVIAGATPEGTEFGAYEFLERFVGVRWLFPTEVGDYVPKRRDLTIPGKTSIRDEPAFMQAPAVASKPTHQVWARRMRFWTRLKFHHNLVRLFPPTQYTKTHPELFPVLRPGGTKRYLPATNTEGWQPCFTAPGIVDEAAKNIIRYLDANPRVRSYSFGVNDSGHYCQCDRCRREYIPGETFLGMPQYTDAYYKFVNAVVEKVLQVHPDVWFGCLAYSNVGKPPVRVDVHPRVIPFLTYDTMQLLDPERRRKHEALVEAWGKKCTFLGRYDYTYGDNHVPPRLYLHHWAKYVRWARAHKVRAWYAETYPFFGEGPKYYVMAKIWWNPDRDVDALLEEWHRLAFGKAAAPMKAYFDHWEDYWTRRAPHTDYFRSCKNNQYLLGNWGWLEALTSDDVRKADGWIAAAERLAATPETKARVAVMARSWRYYRAVIETYLARGGPASGRPVREALAILQDKNRMTTPPLASQHQALMRDPVLVFTWDTSYPYGDAKRPPLLDAAETYLNRRDPRLTDALQALIRSQDAPRAALARTLIAVAEGRAENLVPNSGFEAANPLDGWWAGMHQGTGKCRVTERQAYEGAHAVEVTGTFDGYGGVFRTDVPVKPGERYLFVLRARWQGHAGPGTSCQMLTQFRDARGRTLPGALVAHRFQCGDRWRAYLLETSPAPQGAASLLARVDVLSQPRYGHSAYFDALEAFPIR